MSYRVETASSGRAVCKNTECKNAGIKIAKDELRLGTWVPYEDRGSWAWRHWGCISGKMIENLRKFLEGEGNHGSGEYRWDFLDGFEGDEKNSLDHHPDLQEKVKRVVTQGFIDPEDWNGDPEMNQLGLTGTRTAASKKKMRIDKINREQELKELENQAEAESANAEVATVKAKSASSKKKASSKKRGKAELSEDEDEDEDKPVVKKQRGKKAVKDEEEAEEVKPAKKAKGKKAVKEEETEDIKPAKKPRAKKSKEEESVSSPDAEDGTEDWSVFSVPKLKQELEIRGLSKTGKKADLISRLEGANGIDELSVEPKTDPIPSSPPIRRNVKNEPSDDVNVAETPSSTSEPDSEASLPKLKGRKATSKTAGRPKAQRKRNAAGN